MTLHSLESLQELRDTISTVRVEQHAPAVSQQRMEIARYEAYQGIAMVARSLGVLVSPTDCVFFQAQAHDVGVGTHITWGMRWQPTTTKVILKGGPAGNMTTSVGNAFQDEVSAGLAGSPRRTVYRLWGWDDNRHRWVFTPDGKDFQ